MKPVEAPKIFFSGYFRNCLNCDSLRWSHTHFICIPAVHIISLVKKMHKEYKNNILKEMNTLSSKHSQDFWKQINNGNLKTVEESRDIAPEDWINHFQNLLYESHESEANENLENNLIETPTLSNDSLDRPITAKEIRDHISKLKTKKSSGTDSILNEMIKHGRYFLVPSLERIFNNILQNGTFPVEWNIGVIKPIYKKKGDKKSPANYRGITLTSCLGKLFTSILQSRLNKFIEQENILNPEQFGFRPNARTTDSLFILQQLLHKYTKQHKKLYIGFIDYEKAFDSVWQHGMIHKLQKNGIQGKLFKLLNLCILQLKVALKLMKAKSQKCFHVTKV